MLLSINYRSAQCSCRAAGTCVPPPCLTGHLVTVRHGCTTAGKEIVETRRGYSTISRTYSHCPLSIVKGIAPVEADMTGPSFGVIKRIKRVRTANVKVLISDKKMEAWRLSDGKWSRFRFSRMRFQEVRSASRHGRVLAQCSRCIDHSHITRNVHTAAGNVPDQLYHPQMPSITG